MWSKYKERVDYRLFKYLKTSKDTNKISKKKKMDDSDLKCLKM